MANKGLEIVGDGFDKWIEETRKAVKGAVAEAVAEEAEAVAATARELAPVRSGAMRDAIFVKHEPDSMFASVRVDAAKAWYAFLVHFGYTKGGTNVPGRAFMYQAEEVHSAEFKERIQQKIEQETKK